ncbi:VanW family protein [Corynebacterium aquilae]|nr:VanW family protein [Corynebacterium aquilae]
MVIAGGVAYGADFVLMKDRVPRGTVVAGTNIGGDTTEEATRVLTQVANERNTRPVKITAGEKTAEFIPADIGLGIDIPATIAAAGEPSLNPIVRIKSFFVEHPIELVSDVDQQRFVPATQELTNQLHIDPTNGAVNFQDGDIVTTDAADGQDVDPSDLRRTISASWLDADGVTITPNPVKPQVNNDAVKKAAEGPAAKAISGDIIAKGRDNIDGIIPIERMGEILHFDNKGGQLEPVVDTAKAQELLAENLSATEVQMRNAKISFVSGNKTVTPSADGVAIDWEATMDGFADRVIGDKDREFPAAYKDEKATFTTAQAEKATFDDKVSSFTTGGFSYASGVNIRKVAQMVDGAIVAPGQTFSLNGYTGPRGTAQGFIESGIIMDGHADKAVGGGISQFATTLYNAAYFAGMEDVAHTPHSYYISRYPAGREATVFEGAIDLQFKNTSPYPVLIRAYGDQNTITVDMMGKKTYQVDSTNGGRWAETQPKAITLSGDSCVPSTGAPGFTTSDTRVVRDLSGNEVSRNTTTTVYDPAPIVKCS